MRVPVNMYKKFFKILLFTFIGIYFLQIITTAFGHPIGEVNLPFLKIYSTKLWPWVIQPLLVSILVDGIVNFFLTVRIIREAMGLDHWPAIAIVLMTLFFALEMLLGTIFVIPNIIIFGLKGRVKNRAYEVNF